MIKLSSSKYNDKRGIASGGLQKRAFIVIFIVLVQK